MAETYSQSKTFENWWSTSLSQQLSSSGAGDYEVYLNDEPDDDEGWLVLSPGATNTREIIRYWKPTGSWSGYVLTSDENRGLAGGNAARTHLLGATVSLRIVAQQAAYSDRYIEPIKRGLVEADSTIGLALKIAPWYGYIGGAYVSYNGTTHFESISPVDGTSVTGTDSQSVTNNATNYVELDSTGAVQINTSAWSSSSLNRKRLALVVAASGNITSVVDSRSFGSLGDAGVSSVSPSGGTQITGDVELVAGSNVSLNQSGQQITINAGTTGTSTTFLRETPTGTVNGVNTSFTISQAPASTFSIIVWINGINTRYGSGAGKFTISGTTITFGTAPATGSVLEVLIMY